MKSLVGVHRYHLRMRNDRPGNSEAFRQAIHFGYWVSRSTSTVEHRKGGAMPLLPGSKIFSLKHYITRPQDVVNAVNRINRGMANGAVHSSAIALGIAALPPASMLKIQHAVQYG